MGIRKGTESGRQFSYFDKKPDEKYMTDTYVMIISQFLLPNLNCWKSWPRFSISVLKFKPGSRIGDKLR